MSEDFQLESESPAPAAPTTLAVAPGSLDLRCCDCMELMRAFPAGHFDLAIVDPPYGISAPRMGMATDIRDGIYKPDHKGNRSHRGAGKLKDRALQRMPSDWDLSPPGMEYFAELRRVSRHQIIWGGNYFPLPPTRCVISWDKEQPWENFSQWEMAWTSFDRPAALFKWQNGSNEPGKIHPTQKPVALYKWLLNRFAEPGQRILDTHLGSMSIAIACHYFGAHLTGSEIDPVYHAEAIERVRLETAQTTFIR